MEQLLSDAAYICTGVYLTILGVFAVLGNIFVLYVLCFGRPRFIKIHVVLLFVITISDLLVAITALPITAVSGYNKRWYFDELTCVFTGFVVYFLVMCNINSLCSMAIIRYVIVCRPELEHCIRGKRIVWWIIIICAYALFWTGAPLVGWSSYGHEPFQTSCTLNWYGKSISDVTYNSLCIVFCYCVPVLIFVFCYYNVLKTSLLRTTPIISQRQDMDNIIETMTRNAKLRASRHMTWICISMVISFLITWTPYAVLTFLNIIETPVPSSVQVFPTMFAKLSCVANPVIYSGFCHNFRDAASRAITCKNKIFPLHVRSDIDITATMLEENGRRERPKSHSPCVSDMKQTKLKEVKTVKVDNDSLKNSVNTCSVETEHTI